VKPRIFLVLSIAGPQSDKDEMDAIVTAVAATLKLFDPAEALKQQAENLKRGARAVNDLTVSELRPLLPDGAQYFTVSTGGRTTGMVKIIETIATDPDGVSGLRVIRWAVLKEPGRPRQLIHEDLFATADRSSGRWRHVRMTGQGRSARRTIREAIKQQELLLVHSRQQGQARKTRTYPIPAAVRSAYLPEAMGGLATRLIDRSKPRAFGFAAFDPAAGAFDMRTIRVVGPEVLRLAGRSVQATRLTDQRAADAPLADVWVDAKGMLLRMRSADGATIERAQARNVVRAFAAELLELEKLSAVPTR